VSVETTLIAAASLSFGVVTLAEIGDKSQLVCMALASRNKPRPVLFGAITAFMLLNLIAVTIGSSLAMWLPSEVVIGVATIMFAIFGIQSLMSNVDDDDECETQSSRNIFITTFSMILIAEFGDKTQLAVAGLSTTESPLGVWLGATLALILTSALGIYAGKRWLAKLNPNLLHKLSGAFFLLLAGLGAAKWLSL
jgi:putative Ca2+/H+ antiporter (TMEM165/GDT1 family)